MSVLPGAAQALGLLHVDPCVPASLRRFTVVRRFRGALYEITVENPDGAEKGVRSVTLDGREIEGQVLPVQSPGSRVSVRVLMG